MNNTETDKFLNLVLQLMRESKDIEEAVQKLENLRDMGMKEVLKLLKESER